MKSDPSGPCGAEIGDSAAGERLAEAVQRVPPHFYCVTSAVFHYLGPAFAVLLYARIEPLGVARLRIASATVIFVAWRRPWRPFRRLSVDQRRTVVALGVVLALM
ncbi:MAG: EamA family transporter, partial [Thermomicrobiales bacterium]